MFRAGRIAGALLLAAASALAGDGWFHTKDGALFVPLGGFHGNEIPVAWLKLHGPRPYIWDAQRTEGRGHVDLVDASDAMLDRWLKRLAANGVTAVRVFPRARANGDTLDLCGKVNPELQRALSRAFAAARPYGIRFLVQILPEPPISVYWNHSLATRYARPRYSKEELERLTPPQRRFLLDGKHVEFTDWFTDPDVLACQKLYLESALAWIAREPQVFALEVYNEQGLSRPPPERLAWFAANWEETEIAWTAEIVRFIHERLPGMPVTISHPGHGIARFNPIEWSRRAGVDFYSTHFYAGDCGENARSDFAAATAATSAVVRAEIVNFPGEWGVLKEGIPKEIRRRAHRDALWLTLLSGAPGFMQWTYDFIEEYRWPKRVFGALPREFSPDAPPALENIAEQWRAFQATPLETSRQNDPNLQSILAAYNQALERGVPLGFTLTGAPRPAPARLPIRARGGYQLAYLADSAHRIWIAYLRSRKVRAFGGTYLGVPVKAPLRLTFDLPEGEYTAALIDLGRNKVKRLRIRKNSTREVSRSTDADYVLLVASSSSQVTSRLRSIASRPSSAVNVLSQAANAMFSGLPETMRERNSSTASMVISRFDSARTTLSGPRCQR